MKIADVCKKWEDTVATFDNPDGNDNSELIAQIKMKGRSAALAELSRTVQLAAPTNCTILIQGDRSKIGKLKLADTGTVFLDEIGDLKPELQVKLLRFLQEGEIHSVGSNATTKVNVRVIAASHVNLEEAVAKGKFREDLYYRLNVVRLFIPAAQPNGRYSAADRAFPKTIRRSEKIAPDLVAARHGFLSELVLGAPTRTPVPLDFSLHGCGLTAEGRSVAPLESRHTMRAAISLERF